MQSNNKISYEEASKYIRNKPHLHEAVARDGWELPTLSSSICSMEFLQNVRNGSVYCPRREDLNVKKKCF